MQDLAKKIDPLLESGSVILFDGTCLLCNKAVQFVLKNDVKKHFYVAPLQAKFTQTLLSNYHDIPTDIDSIILLTKNRSYTKSAAVLKIATNLKPIYKLANIAYLIPPFVRDRLYDYIAKNRTKWFAPIENCALIAPAYKSRILH